MEFRVQGLKSQVYQLFNAFGHGLLGLGLVCRAQDLSKLKPCAWDHPPQKTEARHCCSWTKPCMTPGLREHNKPKFWLLVISQNGETPT